jgi:hypothetical protein
MTCDETYAGLRAHLRSFFAGHDCTETVWTVGPGADIFPRLRISQFAPGPKAALWVYVTIGAWEAGWQGELNLEFLIAAPREDLRHVELATMTACYHRSHHLGLGHTVPLGEPWLAGSACDHLLISLPYPFGSELENCCLKSRHLQILWMLPITRAERDFKVEHGLEALEQKFDEAKLEYWDPARASVV